MVALTIEPLDIKDVLEGGCNAHGYLVCEVRGIFSNETQHLVRIRLQ